MKRLLVCVAIGLVEALFCGSAVAVVKVDVAEELERLAAAYGFEIRPEHLDKTRDYEGRAELDDLLPRLRELLVSFDHIILQTPDGGVERVIILGETVQYTPPPDASESAGEKTKPEGDEKGDKSEPADEAVKEEGGDIVLATQRKGEQHLVQVALEGAEGAKVDQQLLVDTGADHVVLPASMLSALKIPESSLKPTQAQTANGKIDARMSLLDAVWLGEQRITGVTATFIDDDKLGGNALLGMSVLGRYQMAIDDDNNTLTLTKK